MRLAFFEIISIQAMTWALVRPDQIFGVMGALVHVEEFPDLDCNRGSASPIIVIKKKPPDFSIGEVGLITE
jgi:hypothetical protein